MTLWVSDIKIPRTSMDLEKKETRFQKKIFPPSKVSSSSMAFHFLCSALSIVDSAALGIVDSSDHDLES